MINAHEPKNVPAANAPRKQIGLKRFLILSYTASLLLVLAYYAAPIAIEWLQMAVIVTYLFSMAVGFLGMVISLAISVSIALFSRRSEEKKRRDQKIAMRMLISFVAITIGPPLVAFCAIIAIENFL